jgi:phage-related protein (TIGR01555 family)
VSAKSEAPVPKRRQIGKDAPSKLAARKTGKAKSRRDTTDTFGMRGAGASWQASFGMPLNEQDLLFAVRREPVANRIVFQVAHDIFDNWFTVEEVAEKPDPNFDKEVQKALNDLSAKTVFTEMAVYERLFGWAIIAITYVDGAKDVASPVQSPKEIRELIAYSSLQFTVQTSDEDKDIESERFGLPVVYTLRRQGGEQIKLHYTRAIHCATRLLDHPYRGMSVLEAVYDDITVLRNIRWGLGQTIFRYGSGFPDVEIQGAKKKTLDDLEASQQFKSLQARTYFLHDEKTKLEFKGVAGRALNPEPYYMPVMENIAAGSGLPLAILRGAQAGALTGSEVNEREYFKLISDAQSRYEPSVRELIDALIECGQIETAVEDYQFIWLGGAELSESQKAVAELNLAQAREKMLNYMTVDEVRAEEDLQPLPDNAGKVVLGIERIQQALGQGGPTLSATSSASDAEEKKKWYVVKVTHEPSTGKRLKEPQSFEWKTGEEALSHASRLGKAGLKPHQLEVSSLTEGDQCSTKDGKPGHWVTLENGGHVCLP